VELVGVETLREVDQSLGTIRDAAGPLHGLQQAEPTADAVEQAMREALGDVPVRIRQDGINGRLPVRSDCFRLPA